MFNTFSAGDDIFYYTLITATNCWTQIRPDKMSGLTWYKLFEKVISNIMDAKVAAREYIELNILQA